MSDKELLELAAKAAGITNLMTESYSNEFGFPLSGADDDNETYQWWNPLTDDGDAFRLAVKLDLASLYYSDDDYAACNQDGYAATRRAIVRTAAEIWRMK